MHEHDAEHFYDAIADKYSWFFSSRSEIARITANQIIQLIEPYHPHTILDCSCGDGLQAISLAQSGFSVTASDISGMMVKKAREYAAKAGVAVNFHRADFRRLENVFDTQYDAVLTWGNSIAHMMSSDDILSVLGSIHRRVKDGGLALFEMRNYDLLLEERRRFLPMRINSVQDGYRYSILYVLDYYPKFIRFNIIYLIESLETGETHMEQESVDYNPIGEKDFREYLSQTGFSVKKVDASRNGICYLAQKEA